MADRTPGGTQKANAKVNLLIYVYLMHWLLNAIRTVYCSSCGYTRYGYERCTAVAIYVPIYN